ncbi:LpqB family beta-propeller domain-containing protein [Pseudonocardia kunmingensis]|uniref:Sporulation and spore germination protein n=1 Tax=Pseudonocardia kunmingensis TaxID=630975 RepID=A0A543E0W3_9PSEU|nr:LpqB family beta-propeller domain-containing protein [Pseudonocardia kunmingensis]TQM15139.1 sporulation and spore germination protein [Pseudonocardia kunmingensis]
MNPRRRGVLVALLLALCTAAGCASVPETSTVQVLRQVGGGEDAMLPPGPVEGSNPLDLVRDFVFASGSSTERHGAARRFLAPEAEHWDDAAGLTVLDGQFDTVPAPGAASLSTGVTTIRIRGTAIGRLTSSGSFEPEQRTFQQDVTVVRRDGQWRISNLPPGVVVPLTVFRDNYKPVRTWFVDPVRRMVVADQRHVPSTPSRAQAARVMELLLAGPSPALQGAVVSLLPPGAQLRANVTVSADGALIVDLTRLGDLDEPSRMLLAAQVVLSLSEVNVGRVRLLADGEPLVPGRQDLTREDVAALSAVVQPAADVPGLVVAGGRVRQLSGPEPSAPLPGAVGDGAYDVESAASTVDGTRLAAVTRSGGRRSLVVGDGSGDVSAVSLTADTMTRPSWTPTGGEVWTVLDSAVVARVLVGDTAPPRTGQVNAEELAALGPIADLRLSRDGVRVLAVVGGGLHTGAVVRSIDGEVAIRNIRRLRPDDLGEVVAADWRSVDSAIAITRTGEMLVAQVSVDGLVVQPVLSNNLTPPLTAIAAASNRPLWVTDQTGVWSFGGGDQVAWRQVLGGAPDAVPLYPG